MKNKKEPIWTKHCDPMHNLTIYFRLKTGKNQDDLHFKSNGGALWKRAPE
jgi:hypothetical protein